MHRVRDGETTIKIKVSLFEGGRPWGQRGQIPLSEASKTGFGGGALWYVFPPENRTIRFAPPSREGNCAKTLFFFFRGERHDNKILKVQIRLSRNFVVIAQAPIGKRG